MDLGIIFAFFGVRLVLGFRQDLLWVADNCIPW